MKSPRFPILMMLVFSTSIILSMIIKADTGWAEDIPNKSNNAMEAKVTEVANNPDGSIAITLTLSNTEGKSPIHIEGGSHIPTITLNGGMEAQIDSIGRNEEGDHVAISLILSNNGKNTFYIACIGPTSAQDNAGGDYTCQQITGIYSDGFFFQFQNDQPKKLQQFTQMDPGTSITLNFKMEGKKSKGNVMSFSTLFATRIVSDPIKDETLSTDDKIKGVRTMNVSFPSMPVTEKK